MAQLSVSANDLVVRLTYDAADVCSRRRMGDGHNR